MLKCLNLSQRSACLFNGGTLSTEGASLVFRLASKALVFGRQ